LAFVILALYVRLHENVSSDDEIIMCVELPRELAVYKFTSYTCEYVCTYVERLMLIAFIGLECVTHTLHSTDSDIYGAGNSKQVSR
jgi:hypothetical protein